MLQWKKPVSFGPLRTLRDQLPESPNMMAFHTNRLAMLLCILAVAGLAGASTAANLLVNPGFESGVAYVNQTYGTTDTVAGWTYVTDPSSSGFWNGAETAWGGGTRVRTGTQCLRVFHYGPRFGYPTGWRTSTAFQEVEVQPNVDYTASAWVFIYLEDGSSIGDDFRAGIIVEELNAAGGVVGRRTSYLPNAAEDWRRVQVSFRSGPNTARVRFILYQKWLLEEEQNHINWDDCALDGPDPDPLGIREAWSLPDGASVRLSGKVVSAAFDGFFYVQEQNWCGGIRVNGRASPGDVLEIAGRMTTVGAERAIEPISIGTLGKQNAPRPLAMPVRSVFRDPPVVGLLARLAGRVVSSDPLGAYFGISDGSPYPVRVAGSAAVGDFVRVTGVLGLEPAQGGPTAILRCVRIQGTPEGPSPDRVVLRAALVFDEQLKSAANAQGQNYWWTYMSDVLDKLGLTAEKVSPSELPSRLGEFSTIFLGSAEEQLLLQAHGAGIVDALGAWVESGGVLICSLTSAMDGLAGNQPAPALIPSAGDWEVSAEFMLRESAFTHQIPSPLHPSAPLLTLGVVRPVQCIASQALGVTQNASVITARKLGAGWAFYFGFDLGQTFWVIQQGRPVDDDYDGDGYWRTGDAMVTMEYESEVPYTDELLILLQNMVGVLPQPLIGRLPPTGDSVPHALIFYGGDDENGSGIQMLASQFMASRGLPYHINCMPGGDGTFGFSYEDALVMEASGTNLSLHYDFISGFAHPGGFTQADVDYQTGLFSSFLGRPPGCIVTHWTRWTGWWEPAEWMMLAGVKGDNSRFCVPLTSSNPVNKIGFAFGSAFPCFFWTDGNDGNRRLDFVEVPISGYELGYLGSTRDPEQVRRALMMAVHYGYTYNFFYHPIYIAQYASCRDAIDTLLAEIGQQKLNVLHRTPDEVVEWWMERSGIMISDVEPTARGLAFTASKPSPGRFIVNVPLGDSQPVEVPYPYEVREAFGNRWLMMVLPSGETRVEIGLTD